MKAPLGLALAGLALVCAKVALAGPPAGLETRLQVGEGLCFDAATLARSVQRWAKTPDDPRIRVQVRRDARMVSFTLVRDDTPLGERTLEVPSAACDDVTDAVAVAIAIALDANTQAAAEPPVENGPPPESMFRADPGLDSQGEPAPATARNITVSATAVVTAGVLDHVAPGFTLGLNKSWTPWFETQLLLLGVREIGGQHYPAGVPQPPMGNGLLAGILDGCTGPLSDPILRACLGVAFGTVFIDELDVSGEDVRPLAWGGATARLDGKISLARRLALALSLDGFVPVLRPPVPGSGNPPASDIPPVGIGFSAGLAYDL